MTKTIATLLLILATLHGGAAEAAETELNKDVSVLGVSDRWAYFSVVGGFATNCKWNSVYADYANSELGKIAYTQLLAAKHANKKLSRIVYEKDTDDFCTLTLVEVKD